MSPHEPYFLAEADEEVEAAYKWYRQQGVRVATGFLEELQGAVALIAASPATWPKYELGTRRYVLPRYPFSIIYRLTREGIEVVAVAHQKRNPNYWHER